MRALDWSGIYGVQFILADAGAYVIDLHPRVSGSIALAIGAGQHRAAIWTDLLLGLSLHVRPYGPGVLHLVSSRAATPLSHLPRSGSPQAPRP